MSRLVLLAVIAPLIGCSQPLHLEDDVSHSDDNTVNGERPYVRGTEIRIEVAGRGHSEIDEDWSFTIEDESVLQLLEERGEEEEEAEEDERFGADFLAIAAGTTRIALLDPDGQLELEEEIEIVFPDEITLSVATAERMQMPELDPEGCDFQVLEGGTGGLIAQYWVEGREAFGSEVLTLASLDEVELSVDHSYSGKNLDWPQITPLTTGDIALDMLVDGHFVDAVTLSAVSYDAIASAAWIGGETAEVQAEDWVDLLVLPYDADDCPIYGSQWGWEVDGELDDERGDLYRYEYDPDVTTTLLASLGDFEKTIEVHGVGEVSSSNVASCSASGGAALLIPAVLSVLGLVRRREDG